MTGPARGSDEPGSGPRKASTVPGAPASGSRAERGFEIRGGRSLRLGPLHHDELGDLFEMFEDVVRRGEGFPHEPPLTPSAFTSTWVEPVTLTLAARLEGELSGAYYLKPNFVGRAAHIANAGYMVRPRHRRLGIGRAMLEDSISRAPLLGFDAIQFNLVFASNPARALYEGLGWKVVGRIPHAVDGEDCFVYWRSVGGSH